MSLLVDTPPSSFAAGSGGRGRPYHHVRRKFFDLTTSPGTHPIAEEPLARIGELYDIENAILGAPPNRRKTIRQRQAKPKVEALRRWWASLCCFLDDGTIEIDINAAERAIRPIALGRKNSYDLCRGLRRTSKSHSRCGWRGKGCFTVGMGQGAGSTRRLPKLLSWDWLPNGDDASEGCLDLAADIGRTRPNFCPRFPSPLPAP